MALLHERDDPDQMTGDSMCSTLSDCSLLDIDPTSQRWSSQSHQQHHRQLPPADGGIPISDGVSGTGGGVIPDDNHGDAAATDADMDRDGDTATFRSAVVRQFKDDIDRLVMSVTNTIDSGTDYQHSSSKLANFYSEVNRGCLSLLHSRVLPPLLERFQQRVTSSLHMAGRFQSSASTVAPQPHSRQSASAPFMEWLPRPVPRLRTVIESAPVCAQLPPHPPMQHPPPPPPPLPPPPHLRPSSRVTPAVKRLLRPGQDQTRVSSPFFLGQTAVVQRASVTTAISGAATQTQAVRNNSSLKANLQRQRTLPQQQNPPLLASSLIHTFTIRDSPSLREILFAPDDRKMKSISQRYGCYISVLEKTKRVGHPLHKVVVRAPNEKALRMCINALDNGLNWGLASQLSRANRKAGGNPSSTLAK